MKLNYQVSYSQRKTLSVSVERDASVVVRAPAGLAREKIEKFLDAKKFWLFEKMKSDQKYPSLKRKKEFISGESIPYLGRNYLLKVSREALGDVHFNGHFLISSAGEGSVQDLLRQWYVDQAQRLLEEKARFFAQALGVEFREVLVRGMRTRWGSCSKNNNLSFSWRIMKAPPYVIDYIVVHELAHLLEANHTARFWNIVAVQVPGWQKAKAWLKDNGHILEVDF